jgi:2',3'-cyclic-nucleotide 2'-phosphodiesterase/3'-nucleotidase
LLAISLLVLLGLTACERPAPGSEQPPATATLSAPSLGATLLPPVAASPTPGVPVAASPTPTIDPALQPTAAATPLPAEQPTTAPDTQTSPSGEVIHVVQAGENLYRIGLRYGFTYQELAAYNGLANPDSLSIGQQIRIPPRP